MEKELEELLEKQTQLNAMAQSVDDFARKLKDQQDKFLQSHFKLGEGPDGSPTVNFFEILRQATKSKLIL